MRRPNILLITSDQQHWNTLGCQGSPVKTPNLDRLAKQGTRFSRAYCPNPTCTPTRASMITGQYPSQHGAWSLGTKLPETAHTVGEDLQDAGYKTSLIGKAHFQQLRNTGAYPSIESNPLMQDLEFWRNFTGPFYGFQRAEMARNHTDEFHVGQHYALWMEKKGFKDWKAHFAAPGGTKAKSTYHSSADDPGQGSWSIPEEFHYDAWIAERSGELLEEHAKNDEPFFLWASFLDPHPPYLVPKPWDTMYDPEQIEVPEGRPGEHEKSPPHHRLTQTSKPDFKAWQEKDGHGMHGFQSHLHEKKKLAKDIAIYYGMISLMDKYIGKILDRLEALGLAENTLVVFTTDHGHFYGHHGLIAKGPFHYEDMIRVPFLARLPGKIPAGETSPALQSLVDLPQTFLDFCGIPAPRTMTGVSQKETWCGERPFSRSHVIVENHHQPTTIHVKTVVTARYKLTAYYNQPYGELYDLEADPGEFKNLWDDPDSQALKGEMLLKLIHAEMGKEPMWMPRVWGA